MPAQYIYSHSGTIVGGTASNVDLSARVRAYTTSLLSNAEEGSVAQSTLVVDDPDAGLDIHGLRGMSVYETSEGSNSRLTYRGYIADREVSRGPFRTGESRIWTVNMVDQNSLIARRIMLGADCNRPAETDVARVQWLMTTTEIGGIITDSTYVSTAEAVDMDAVDYRNQRAEDILNDCAQASGKNYFVLINEIPVTPTNALFYDFTASDAYASTLQLSNVLSDVDSVTTFAVGNEDTKLSRDPSRVYDGIVLAFDGGQVYVQASSAFGELWGQNRDTMAPSVNVKTTAKATARATRYLVDSGTEDDVVYTSVVLPLDKVNHLKEGMAVYAKFSHLPGYGGAFHRMRVLSRTVTMTSEEYYTLELKLSNGPFSPPAPEPAGLVQYAYSEDILRRKVQLDNVPAAGDTLVAFVARRDNEVFGSVYGWTLIGASSDSQHFVRRAAMYYRVATADETDPNLTRDWDGDGVGDGRTYLLVGLATTDNVGIAEITGAYDSKVSTQSNMPFSSTTTCGGSITPTAATPCIIFGVSSGDPNNCAITPSTDITELDQQWGGWAPQYWVGYRIIASPSGSYTISGTQSPTNHYCGVTAVFV
jgi:hypothetical protein